LISNVRQTRTCRAGIQCVRSIMAKDIEYCFRCQDLCWISIIACGIQTAFFHFPHPVGTMFLTPCPCYMPGHDGGKRYGHTDGSQVEMNKEDRWIRVCISSDTCSGCPETRQTFSYSRVNYIQNIMVRRTWNIQLTTQRVNAAAGDVRMRKRPRTLAYLYFPSK